ncbi:hypothetical protein [Treponema sp.]|uniref:hypothetical protein n=1 Tax=Treponema sp. TaxID=166 RepID=UPI00298DB142|nr:hypothetical protein [Treponema sp.]
MAYLYILSDEKVMDFYHEKSQVKYFSKTKKACVVRVCPKTRLATEGRTGAALGQFLTGAGFPFFSTESR